MNELYYSNFSVYLRCFLEKRSLNYSSLARILGYKSKTTVSRVLDGEAKDEAMRRVCDDILSCSALDLTAEEREALIRSLDISRIGLDGFKARASMWELLRRRPERHHTASLTMFSFESSVKTDLDSFLRSISDAENEIILINCANRSITERFAELIDSTESCVEHYILINNELSHTVEVVDSILPIVYSTRYQSYTVELKALNNTPGIMSYNAVVIRSRSHDNSLCEYQILMEDENNGVVTRGLSNIYLYWKSVILKCKAQLHPIKSSFPNIVSCEDYIGFTENYRRMEQNNNIYTYRPDIPLNYINADIARAALLDGLSTDDIEFDVQKRHIERLTDIQRQRFYNIFTQKKVTQGVLCTEAMKKFARTGVQSDHFFAMRPYTVDERVQIFSNLLFQLTVNPFFNLYLLKNDADYIETEATCFESIGVQFTSSFTDYDLSHGHTEAIITQSDFTGLFISFFIEELVRRRTLPQTETTALLHSLIAELGADV